MKSTKQKTRANTPPPRPAQARGKSAPAAAPALAAKAHLWRYGVAIAAAFCALLIVYGPALNGPFLLDDTYLPYMLPQFADAPLSVWLKYVRPMLMLTFWMNYVRSGHDTYAYHFFNIVLHLSNGLWIYLAIRKLLDFERVKTWAREVASVFAAGLFLLHPLQTESVSYVASRSETLSVFFVLAAFVVFVYSRGARITWPRAAAVIVLFGAAVLSKEHTVVLLPLLLLTDYYWNPGFSFRGIAKNWRLYAPLAVAGCFGAWFVWRVLRAATTAGFSVKGLPWYDYLFPECRVIWIYVRLFIAPFGLNLDRDVPISRSVIDYGAIIGLIGLVALAAAAWIYRRKFPLASYGYFVFLLLLAPTSSIVPLADPYAERRMYLPFIGLLLIVAEFLSRWKAARNTILLTLAGVLAVEAAVTYQRNQLWGNAIAIWKDTSDKSPRKVRPNFQLASAYYDAGRCGDAVNQYAPPGGSGNC